ncbi:hypothetical protein [Streptomyces sp. NPDC051162]|uniref:hypothetical protein n=1 Tax=Streptomyces sp. NPDC051162 TaxID=3154747 RepID=UPI0034415AB3
MHAQDLPLGAWCAIAGVSLTSHLAFWLTLSPSRKARRKEWLGCLSMLAIVALPEIADPDPKQILAYYSVVLLGTTVAFAGHRDVARRWAQEREAQDSAALGRNVGVARTVLIVVQLLAVTAVAVYFLFRLDSW